MSVSRAGFLSGVVSAAMTGAAHAQSMPWWAVARQRVLWIKRADGNDVLPNGVVLPEGYSASFMDQAGYDVLCYALRDAHPTARGRGWVAIAPALFQVIWEIQQVAWAELGYRVPVICDSGYRTSATNREVGGVVNSEHVAGAAFDHRIPGLTIAKTRTIARSVHGSGGVGYYPPDSSGPGFIHVDVGPYGNWQG